MRGKRYQEVKNKIDSKKVYSLNEAIDFIKNNPVGNFDETIELHIKLGVDSSKTDQHVHGSVVLPAGALKKRKIAIFATPAKLDEARAVGADLVGGAELIEQIKQNGKCDFEIAIAEPAIMKDLAQIAKILGPKGLMPTPKNETITTDFKKTMADLSGGKINFKGDANGIIHQALAKVSWPSDKTKANVTKFFEAIKKAKPQTSKGVYIKTIHLSYTMGPSLKISL